MKTAAILIVDDEPHIAEVVALKLEQAQFTTVIVRDGIEALKVLEHQHFDLVIADVGMPGMSGLELARRAAAREGGGPPIILLTGISRAAESLDLVNTHVADVIAKPFSPKHLLARALRALENAAKRADAKPLVVPSA